MNYYPFHLGDYAAHTAHLEPLEDLAYRRMLDAYYLREAPLPADPGEVARLIRMRKNMAEVEAVLREFFTLQDDGWHQERCDSEVDRMKEKQSKAQASAQLGVAARRAKLQPTAERTDDQSLSERLTERSANGQPNGELPTPTPTPIPIPKRKKGAKAPLSAELPTWMQELIDLWHEVLPELPGVAVINAERQQAAKDFRDWVLTTCRKDGTPRATNDAEFLTWTRDFFTRARASDFLMGRGPRSAEHQNWRCTFEYLLSAKGMQKVIEQTQDHP